MSGAPQFNAYYYEHCCGQPYERTEAWLAFFGHIADRIVADLAPRRVLDAGCAKGFLVEALRERGVEAFGLDVSEYAIGEVHASVRDYCQVGSITGGLGGDFDLITCIEVVEHMPLGDGIVAINNLCAHAPDVLFSSSPADFREPTHVAVRPVEHWAEAFARQGAFRDVDYDATYILPWAIRFRRRQDPIHRVVREYERRQWQLEQEAQGLRALVGDLQAKVAEAVHDRGRSNHALHIAHVEHHETAQRLAAATARVQEVETALAAAETTLQLTRQEHHRTGLTLGAAHDRIAHMERSRFWQARGWVQRLLGRAPRR